MRNVGRPKVEKSATKSVRLPVRLWKLIKQSAIKYRSINELIARLIENHLVDEGFMKDKDRKYPKVNKVNKGE